MKITTSLKLSLVSWLILIVGTNCLGQATVYKKNYYPLRQSIRTIVTISGFHDSIDLKFWCYDFYNGYLQSSDAKTLLAIPDTINKNDFIVELNLQYPVYVMPAIRGAGAISPGSVFKNVLSTRYVAYGMLIEPGDSIHVDLKLGIDDKKIAGYQIGEGVFDEIPFFDKQRLSGRGVEKLWCIQEILRNTRMYEYPNHKSDFFAFSDSISTMVLNTIKIFNGKISPTATSIIKSHYIPMMAFDVSEIVASDGLSVERELDIHNEAVKKIYKSELTRLNKIINPKDSSLVYGYFFSQILKKRALLQYAIDSNLEYKSIVNRFNMNCYKALVKYIPNCPIKERVLAEYIQLGFTQFGARKDVEDIANLFFGTTDKSNPLNKLVYDHYMKLKVDFGKGGKTYPFSLPDTTGKIVKMSDFKGKAILMDFYYNGCVGCVEMMPFLTKVQDHFSNNDSIVFISVSIDRTKNSWLEGIGKAATKNSIHLNARENINDPLIQFYDIYAYPQLVLIDKKGKLVTTKAPDPRGDKGQALINLINQTLQEN